ncbi:MAG: acetyl-CoA carboxylase biotin carboxylase subunit [candidate division WS1 bacterium]|jgi:acetyl-CoA carboxylase biotin carboxylase subunit|nr:acetyl-CoA carboxylase biotin carboxylase subunit [candidate division WS1 bacterium]
MFEKILVANRGEIACRVIQACRELGIATVAVYSDADADALHVRMADEAICIGAAPNSSSYLNAANILSAAVVTGAEAIHPGYGNLSEDANFAEAAEGCKMTFIGPSAEAISRVGDKAAARKTMRDAGVPVVPGSEDGIRDADDARQIAGELGYPVMVKASGGGGGRGIRIIHNDQQMKEAVSQASSEARSAFGNGELYVEKYMEDLRHVEVQVLADKHGNCVHLGERECSIQHRHQKLLEESPCAAVSSSLRRRMGEAAVRAAQAANYSNAGTVEFLLDQRGRFYFIEMNARVQVEHPVTEMLTGVDIVREQIRVAAGEKLRYEQGGIWFNGHAIECRILAADGERGFMPSPGTITRWEFPSGPGVRVDTGVACGSVVSTHYDPMIAKVICWDQTRDLCIERMRATLQGARIEGIKTTIPYHLMLLGNAYFRRGEITTQFIQRRLPIPTGGAL